MKVIAIQWPDGRETEHDPVSLGMDPDRALPPTELRLFANTTHCILHGLRLSLFNGMPFWERITYKVRCYDHRGLPA